MRRVSPYTYALGVFGSIMLLGICGLCFYLLDQWAEREMWERAVFAVCMLSPAPIYFVGCVMEAYLFWGKYRLEQDAVVLSAFLRKEIRMAYADIKYIGAGYVVVNGGYQFWIYISKQPVDISCLKGRINKLPMSAETIKIQYRPEVVKELMCVLPPDLREKLEESEKTIQMVKVGII